MKKNLFLLFLILFVVSSCKKEKTINDLINWRNKNSNASGLRNNYKWNPTKFRLYGLGGKVFMDLLEYDADSVLIADLSVSNFPPQKGVYPLKNYSFLTKEINSYYTHGYDDQFFTYILDTTQTNTLEITEFDLDGGIIKGKINAEYSFGSSIAKFKNMEFTFLR